MCIYIHISPLCYPFKLLSQLHRHGLISNDMGTSDLYMPNVSKCDEVCVCVHAYIHTLYTIHSLYANIHIHTYTSTLRSKKRCTHTHTHLYICTYTYIHTYKYTCMQNAALYNIYIYIYRRHIIHPIIWLYNNSDPDLNAALTVFATPRFARFCLRMEPGRSGSGWASLTWCSRLSVLGTWESIRNLQLKWWVISCYIYIWVLDYIILYLYIWVISLNDGFNWLNHLKCSKTHDFF